MTRTDVLSYRGNSPATAPNKTLHSLSPPHPCRADLDLHKSHPHQQGGKKKAALNFPMVGYFGSSAPSPYLQFNVSGTSGEIEAGGVQ